jgi:hypothetical protein
MSDDAVKRRGPKGERERFQLVMPRGVMSEVRRLADKENRSISNMLATLVTEALQARAENEPGPFRPTLRAPLQIAA